VHACLVVGVSQTGLLHDIQHDISQVVGGVRSFFIHAADDARLHHQVAPVVLAHRLGKQEYMLRGLGRKTEQQFTGLIRRYAAVFQVTFVIRVQVLVHPAEGNRRIYPLQADCHVGQPEGLQCFVQGPGRVERHAAANAGYLQQFSAPFFIMFFPGQLFSFGGDAAGIVQQTLTDDPGRFIQASLFP